MAPDRDRLREKIEAAGTWHGWQEWTGTLTHWLGHLLQTPLALPVGSQRVSLAQLAPEACQAEMEFLFAAHSVSVSGLDRAVTGAILPGARRPALQEVQVNGMLKGFIDLVFCHASRYYILDYKSNHLGDGLVAYGPPALAAAMLEHRYDLQYALYTLALHRLLKARLPGYDFDRHVGGAVYLFLRGVDGEGRGVYGDRPSRPLIEWMDATFADTGDGHDA